MKHFLLYLGLSLLGGVSLVAVPLETPSPDMPATSEPRNANPIAPSPGDDAPRIPVRLEYSPNFTADQIRTVHALGANLDTEEIAGLVVLLRSRPRETGHQPPGAYVLKNEIMHALRRQAKPPAELAQWLTALYEDAAQDMVIRDYAVQHMACWYEQEPVGSAAKTGIRETLVKASQDGSTIAGTALLGLHRLAQFDGSVATDTINRLALELAWSSVAPAAVRISALQVCAERWIAGALPAAEALAQNPDNLALQVSAIAALGRMGSAGHLPLLERLQRSKESLKPAAEAALKSLTRKVEWLAVNPDRP